MTKNRRRKQDARRRKAVEAVSYTQALRETQLQPTGQDILGIPTSLPSLTGHTGGWKPGQLITVGGSSGVGKSTFAVNALVAALRDGKSVFLVSLEMHTDELRLKMLSAMSSVPLDFVSGGGRTVAERDAFVRAERELEAFGPRFTVAAWGAQTLETIRNESRRLAGELSGLDLILIDCLDLITVSADGSRPWRALAATSRGLKELALELNLSVMILAQVNGNHGSTDLAPRLSNFRGSGAIALDSDLVIFLHGDQSDSGASQPLQVILAKHRAGDFGQVIDCEVDFSRVRILEQKEKPALLSLADARTRIDPNPILQRWGSAFEAGELSLTALIAKEFSDGWTTDGEGADVSHQADASNELSRLKRLASEGIEGVTRARSSKLIAEMLADWSRGRVAAGALEPQEGLVWPLGEDGEAWFIQGTTDEELALRSLLNWLGETDPEELEHYRALEIDLSDNLSARSDWFWAPLTESDPQGDMELCHYSKDSARWNGQPLVRGIHAEV